MAKRCKQKIKEKVISNTEFRMSNTEVFFHYSVLDIRCSIFQSVILTSYVAPLSLQVCTAKYSAG
jgi:hypothetical protein